MAKQFPTGYDPDDCVWVPIPCSLLPIIVGKVAELERRFEWASRIDWEQGYQAITRWEATLLSCGQNISGLLRDLNIVQAKSLGLNYSNDLAAVLPTLASDLETAEAADTTGILDSIYRHAVGTVRQTEIRDNNDQIACALIGAVVSLVSSGQIPAPIAQGACSVLRGGGQTALDLLGDLIQYGIGNNATLGLRGENPTDPSDNLLTALRGTSEAGATRNVADLLDTLSEKLGFDEGV